MEKLEGGIFDSELGSWDKRLDREDSHWYAGTVSKQHILTEHHAKTDIYTLMKIHCGLPQDTKMGEMSHCKGNMQARCMRQKKKIYNICKTTGMIYILHRRFHYDLFHVLWVNLHSLTHHRIFKVFALISSICLSVFLQGLCVFLCFPHDGDPTTWSTAQGCLWALCLCSGVRRATSWLAMRKSHASCMQASHDGAATCQSVRVGQTFNYPLWKEMYPNDTNKKA